jgi:cytochrome c oxidase subunit 1
LIFLWNVVQSWLEGPKVSDGDSWDLGEQGLLTNEWAWLESRREMAVADGGDETEK